MSKGNTFETQLLQLVFNKTAIPWDAGATQLTVHLHVADPGEAGAPATSPATYGGYTPVDTNRAGSDWTVTGDTVANAVPVEFPECTSGSDTVTHWCVTPKSSTTILYKGALSAARSISSGITPLFKVGTLTTTEN